MRLTEKQIEEFRDIYHKEFNEFLSPKEAEEEASRLLELYALLSRKLPKEEK